ncbi:restriction endonuclease subunit S [Leuconostoc pseudomesenteroides]|uniref:restriction endonuclease subunit S n=1 Tax=Leuconostoc pseudomesenteroides TaxID=33968 RepID=UPI00301CCA61
MTDKTMPALRFRGFYDTWEQRKSKDLFIPKIKKGKTELPVLSVTQTSGVVYRDEVGIDIKYDRNTLSNYKVIEPNDFVISLRSFQGGFELSNKLGIASPAYTVFAPKDIDEHANLFWKYKFKTFSFIQSLKTVTFGIRDGKSISFSEFGDLKIRFPKNIREQEKIGSFFKQLDIVITQNGRKSDLLKRQKQAYLQKIFNQKVRFSGFSDTWEQRKLGEVAYIIGGGTPSTSNPDYWDGDINWYTPAEIGEQVYVSESKKTITELGQQKSSAQILPVDTVLFTSRAGIGKTAILAKESATNQGFQSIVPEKNKLDSYFIFSRTNELKHYGNVTGAGSTFIEVSGKQMAKMPIMLPNIDEQKKIGSFFKQLDNLITLNQQKLTLLKKQKQAYLQKMFI